MMNTRCLRLIAITILINCAYSGRLTIEENKERIANCGKSKLPTPPGGAGEGGFHFELGEASYLLRIWTRDNKNNAATGFFISPRHILTSSQSVFNEKRQWLSNSTDEITENDCVSPMNVEPAHIRAIRVEWNYKKNYTIYEIRNATLFNLCRPIVEGFEIFFSPMLIELKEDYKNVKFPCLADNFTKIEKDDVVHAHRWQWHNENGNTVLRTQYMRRQINEITPDFITTPLKHYKEKVRGGPLVKHNTSVGTLAIGIDASTGYDDRAESTYYDNIKALENDLCKHAGVCASSSPSTTTEVATTSEEESTTSNPDVHVSSDPSFSAGSGPSTPKPTKKPSVTSNPKKPTTPPQRSIDEYEVNPADILYDEEKRREEKEDLDNDFFVGADFRTDLDVKNGFSWILGILVMVLLI